MRRQRRVDEQDKDLEQFFRDPIWRISNLYSIRTRDGQIIPFRPRPQQLELLDMVYRRGLKRIIVLKARQLGFSTLLGIMCTNSLCWGPVGRFCSSTRRGGGVGRS
jgi:hypothetical protein